MVEFVSLTHGGQPVSIEYQWLNREREHTPLLVFLHEGLGSVSMWRDYPRYMELANQRPVTADDLQRRLLKEGEALQGADDPGATRWTPTDPPPSGHLSPCACAGCAPTSPSSRCQANTTSPRDRRCS